MPPEESDDPGDRPGVEAAYDDLAPDYEDELETNPYNEHLSFPGTTDLIPDVAGKRVLDAGCGGGAYSEWLADRGAEVVGIDLSEEMVARARERVPAAEFRQWDLTDPLSFADDDAFDGVVSGLVLGYVEAWRPVFEEFARVLAPGGFAVVSTTHPADEFPLDEDENYFEVELTYKEWDVEMPYYRRPFSEVINPVVEAGLRVDRVAEPQPTEGFREAWPERYEKESRWPVFLCLRAVNPP